MNSIAGPKCNAMSGFTIEGIAKYSLKVKNQWSPFNKVIQGKTKRYRSTTESVCPLNVDLMIISSSRINFAGELYYNE